MKRLREVWGCLAGAGGPLRTAVIFALCVATFAVCAADFRYQTKRSGLLPGVATGKWGVSPSGVSVLNADPSVIILQADPDRPFPYIVNQISRPQGLDRVRVRAEAAAHGVRQGREEWQTARILFWSYDGDGKRMRYLPHELGAIGGTTDWHGMTLVVPVLPETRLLRFIIYNGGVSGRMFVRNITVDEVAETRLFGILKTVLIAGWAVAALWAVWPLAPAAARRPAMGLTLLVAAGILGGTLAPQPLLSNLMQPALDLAQRTAGPLWPGASPDVPEALPAEGAQRPFARGGNANGPPVAAEPSDEQRFEGQRVPFTPDWTPRLEAGVAAHLAAFVLIGAMMLLAFPGTPPIRIFLYLLVFSASLETVQGFHVTRTPEIRDLAANIAGIPLGLLLAVSVRRLWPRRHRREGG
ncbi:MAG: hypothetical protein GEU92_14185 [Alphaproteobacteria bacterium]|nr:hypothetical protein [Alphaproteobacteria bacterium]